MKIHSVNDPLLAPTYLTYWNTVLIFLEAAIILRPNDKQNKKVHPLQSLQVSSLIPCRQNQLKISVKSTFWLVYK